jgi:nitric oxide synthase oxygenase domain/subunit
MIANSISRPAPQRVTHQQIEDAINSTGCIKRGVDLRHGCKMAWRLTGAQ